MKNKSYANFNELVFEERNKFYGAYVLRKRYEDNVLIGLLFGLTFIGMVMAIPYVTNMFKGAEKEGPILSTPPPTIYFPPKDDPIEIEKDRPKQDVPKGQPSEPQRTIVYTAPIVSDKDFSEITPIDELDGLNPGSKTSDGNTGIESFEGEIGNPDGDIVDIKKTWGYYDIQEKPKYPGGDEAMYEYIGTHITYPERAKQVGISGTVHISFVINEFGAVTNVEVLKGIGGGCDEEALRVIKKMKRWKPGKQNGHPVKVKFHIPIAFELH